MVLQLVNNATIIGSIVSQNTNNGINVQGSNYVQILNTQAVNNGLMDQNGGEGISVGLFSQTQDSSSNILLQSNDISLTNGTSVRITGSDAVQLLSNNINGPGTIGSNPQPIYCIKVEKSSNVTISKNTQTGGCNGIFAKGIANLVSDQSISAGILSVSCNLMTTLLVLGLAFL